MEYRGYTITAEVTDYQIWSLDEEGSLVEKVDDGEGLDISGYFITNKNDASDREFFSTSERDVQNLHDLVDGHIAERAA